MKTIFISLILLLTYSFSNELNIASDYNVAKTKAMKENKQIILFIYTDYCPWCKRMKQFTFKNDAVIEQLNNDYVFVRGNKDIGNFPPQFMPSVVPTTVKIDPNSDTKKSVVFGYKNASDFLSFLDKED